MCGGEAISPHRPQHNSGITYAPCGGGDEGVHHLRHARHISIHAPCGGGDCCLLSGVVYCLNFNPRPLWRGRPSQYTAIGDYYNISIHAPCGEGDGSAPSGSGGLFISIHAPCAGGDSNPNSTNDIDKHFNPRPLCRGRLCPCCMEALLTW